MTDIISQDIFVTDKDGKTITLAEYVNQQTEKEKKVESHKEFKDESSRFVPCLSIKHLPAHLQAKEPKGVIRTKVYNHEQIKQLEDIVMSSTTLRVFESVIKKPGWWTAREVADELGVKMSSISSIISQAFHVGYELDWLDRKKDPNNAKGFMYITKDTLLEMKADEAILMYNALVGEKARNRKKGKEEQPVPNKKEESPALATGQYDKSQYENAQVADIAQRIRRDILAMLRSDEPLNVNVNVNVRFGLMKGG